MHKEKLRLRILGGIFVATLLICAVGAWAAVRPSPLNAGRPDILQIDVLKVFGELERGPVSFLHDKHTASLEKYGKNCTACHLKEASGDRLSIKFMRLVETDKSTVMDNFHANCIGCHNQMMSKAEKTGPVICAECHRKQKRIESTRQPMGFDNSLHFRHERALSKKCETCHHVYDENGKKLIYEKGKEGTCRYCHKSLNEEKKLSMRLASHKACVDCHQKLLGENKTAGPIHCKGCHELNEQEKIEKVVNIPRMEMKQPDSVFVKTGLKEGDDTAAIRMSRVPFNHKGHEIYYSNCRTCHHAALSSCGECHVLRGKKEGGGITLEESMHLKNTKASCIGCHNKQKENPQCAGCHQTISPVRKASDATCKVCHLSVMEDQMVLPKDAEDSAELAGSMLEKRKVGIAVTIDEKDIPENVVIKPIAEKYKPVDMPHRKMVLKLIEGVKNNQLAGNFHTDPTTLCQGCHHNSPSTKKPPQCNSCHGKPFDDRNPFRPGLMAAYHQQCMGCHDEMGIQKPESRDCLACHKEK